jgi:aminopeptidase N
MFEESKKISTYLFAIVAGPYSFIESKKKDFVPMKVFFR